MTPTLRIDSGPALEVNVTGDKISNGRLRQLIPIYEERTVDRSLLIEGQGNLLEYLQSQGYLEARVDYRAASAAAGPFGHRLQRGSGTAQQAGEDRDRR